MNKERDAIEQRIADDPLAAAQEIVEAAAFLDRIAEDADNATNSADLNKIAADCRALAAKLRGET